MSRALFVWLIGYQPAVLFSHNKSATINQPTELFSQNKSAPATSRTNRPTYLGKMVICPFYFLPIFIFVVTMMMDR
jgi:hypothetical protein